MTEKEKDERQKNSPNATKAIAEGMNVISTTSLKRKRTAMKQFRGKESIFKRPEALPPRFKNKDVPDYHKHPHKWVRHSDSYSMNTLENVFNVGSNEGQSVAKDTHTTFAWANMYQQNALVKVPMLLNTVAHTRPEPTKCTLEGAQKEVDITSLYLKVIAEHCSALYRNSARHSSPHSPVCELISPTTSLVLTDSSELTAKSFEKLLDPIMYPYGKTYDLQNHLLEEKIYVNSGYFLDPRTRNTNIDEHIWESLKHSLNVFGQTGKDLVLLLRFSLRTRTDVPWPAGYVGCRSNGGGGDVSIFADS
uniref:Uncharacterized protein n=1 Tax=Timema shepardi TaxID=629360 RepID=A0A7R9AY77_TIMSH|nr:unnamed protein product [Timema shepardi]